MHYPQREPGCCSTDHASVENQEDKEQEEYTVCSPR